MGETERKLARKAREIVQENTWDFIPLQMVDKNKLAPQINGSHQQDSSTNLTVEQVEGLRNYIRRLKDGEIDSNLDDYRAMPEDTTWQGNIYPSNPGVKPEVDDVTKALGKFAFDFLVGDVVTILDPDALTEDKLIAAAMMLPPAKVVKLVDKLKDLEKMKDTLDNLDDVSDKVKGTSDNLQDVSKGGIKAKYEVGYDSHLINGTLGKGSRGVVGGHNLNEFKKVFIDAGFDVDDCIVSMKKHPNIEGIYEVEYRIPAKHYGPTGELENIPNQYKTIKYPKTVYAPSIISDSQMLEWGKEAMESGTIQGRNIFGYSSTGIRFEGYVNQITGEITNFYPVIE